MLEGFKLRQDLRLQFWSRVSCQEILYFALKVFKCLDEDPPKLSRTISFSDSLEKTLMLGKIEGGRRRRWQRMRWLNGITDSMDMSLSNLGSWWWTKRPNMLQSKEFQRVRHDWVTELNWTELKHDIRLPSFPPCSSVCAHLSHILLTSCYILVVVKTVLQKINSDLL